VTGVLDAFVGHELAELESKGLLRMPDDGRGREAATAAAQSLGRELVDASSNDYLGLGALGVSRETDVQVGIAGSGASRLIHGTRPAQLQLEGQLAAWVRLQAALLFTSGYAANLGVLSALGAADTLIISDKLNHASIIDGARLGRARIEVVPHLDLAAVELALRGNQVARARWVVTESYFSMDGDGPDLRALRAMCDRFAAGLVVDEAHALGLFGPSGAGRCVEAGIVPDVLIGTMGKAIGTQGAFVAGSDLLRQFLWNRARSFVFSTATSPLLAARTLLHVERTRAADDLRARLRTTASRLRERLLSLGVRAEPGLNGPIVPIVVGDNDAAMRAASALESEGILAQAIRPPTVPPGGARLRITVSAVWPDDAVERVSAAVALALGLGQ
jgi:8-amino-7-oxononanoate synthase